MTATKLAWDKYVIRPNRLRRIWPDEIAFRPSSICTEMIQVYLPSSRWPETYADCVLPPHPPPQSWHTLNDGLICRAQEATDATQKGIRPTYDRQMGTRTVQCFMLTAMEAASIITEAAIADYSLS